MICGGFVTLFNRVAILRSAFFVSSPASRYGRGFGGFCRMATMSCAACQSSASVVISGTGMWCGKNLLCPLYVPGVTLSYNILRIYNGPEQVRRTNRQFHGNPMTVYFQGGRRQRHVCLEGPGMFCQS